jgi:negative regulator of flagellin synthesis FlgM
MVTELKGLGATVITLAGNSSVKGQKPATANTDAVAGAEGGVRLTDLGTRLQTLTQSVADVPQVDAARVESLRQAISESSYQVDAEAVADKLMAFEGLLDNKHKP